MKHLTESEFRILHEMREKQKMYFRTKSKFILQDCKQLEKKVDKILEQLQGQGPSQTSMDI
jgi:DNA-directed RNA polymerase subunit L